MYAFKTREELRVLTEEEFTNEENAISSYKDLISKVKVYRSAPEESEQPVVANK